MKNLNLSLGLDAKQFHEGLEEICRHFAGGCPDEYMGDLLEAVAKAKDKLFGSMYLAAAKRGVLEESRVLNARLAAVGRYLDLCAYDNNAEVRASANVLKRQLGAYGKPLSMMRVASRLTAVDFLLRDLEGAELKPHVSRLPDLSSRLEEVRMANESLRQKQVMVDQANSSLPKPIPLLALKREAAESLSVLVSYLEVMATKEPQKYAEGRDRMVETITRLNALRRKKRLGFWDKFDDDETIDDDLTDDEQLPASA